MLTPRAAAPGWLRTVAVKMVTPTAISIRPMMLERRSSTSVKPDSDLVRRTTRSRRRRSSSAPGRRRAAAGNAALDELGVGVVRARRGQQQARLARIRVQIRIAVHVQRLGAERAAVRRVAVHVDVGERRVDDEVLLAAGANGGVAREADGGGAAG